MIEDITLTEQEKKIFDTIIRIDIECGLGVEYRVAGGWVRDKLLGHQSDDIDIAMDKITGRDFVRAAMEFDRNTPDSGIGKSYIVDQNIEKSKHLETVAIEIHGLKVDFVNLRNESYADTSRIPNMEFGTPREDASRRDLTINAMFYNINTDLVEDYVHGKKDIFNMTLRTPMDPKQTFLDDPLRILRALRFRSRFKGFHIADDVMEAMGDPDVHDAYMKKVSPERAGPEILKLFSGDQVSTTIELLHDTGMDEALLGLPEFRNLRCMFMDQNNPHHGLNLLMHTLKTMENYDILLRENNVSEKDRALALIASWFHDFGKRDPEIGKPKEGNPDHFSYHGHEYVSSDLADVFLKSIGIGSDDRKFVCAIVRRHMMPHAHSGEWTKRQMGKLRRKTTIEGQSRDDIWKFVMWHAHADSAAKSMDSRLEDFPECVQQFKDTQEYMDTPPPVKPLVGGRRLMEMFPNLTPDSRFIPYINELMLVEQDAGTIVDIADAEVFVESIRDQVEELFSK